jgi:hypothetical protein
VSRNPNAPRPKITVFDGTTVTGRINQAMRRLFPNWKEITPNRLPTETDFNFWTPPEADPDFP